MSYICHIYLYICHRFLYIYIYIYIRGGLSEAITNINLFNLGPDPPDPPTAAVYGRNWWPRTPRTANRSWEIVDATVKDHPGHPHGVQVKTDKPRIKDMGAGLSGT